jgi:phosphoketolase
MIFEKIIENKVIIEKGEVKIILNEKTQQRGWMTVDECFRLVRDGIVKMDKAMKNESNN